ncbi:hypothetical protein CH302_19480 [Rhodococcus sp. 15-2388-1-1a]|uniref:hypothetical protein n=1 Tax=Nocardiaceae TaxID=85025 RepID=UPI000568D125|nr:MULTISPECIES: hypothetical protein [Rhodococcus]OZE95123.1 hypothetical protein CH302_19480 [Rhodococcus sp. 15-2388-1-1a]
MTGPATHEAVHRLEQGALAAVIRAELRRSNWNPTSIAEAILAAPSLKYSSAVKPLTAGEYDGHDVYTDSSHWVAMPAAIGPLNTVLHALTARVNSQLNQRDRVTITAQSAVPTGSTALRTLLRSLRPAR